MEGLAENILLELCAQINATVKTFFCDNELSSLRESINILMFTTRYDVDQ